MSVLICVNSNNIDVQDEVPRSSNIPFLVYIIMDSLAEIYIYTMSKLDMKELLPEFVE